MATYGIYDADFMRYEHVIPNLECAKICTYLNNHKEIAVLTPLLTPDKYTKCYIQKDYDDGIYPQELFKDNCIYSGRAFTSDIYVPMKPEIEKTIPNMHIYDKYISKFGPTHPDNLLITKILRCAHVRLSTDESNPKSIEQLLRILNTDKYLGIIFHDYDLGRVKGAYDIIYELGQTRTYVTKKNKIKPYPVGIKFPVQVTSSEELEKWFKIKTLDNLFSLQYNGLMSNETVVKLCTENKKMARQIYYKIDYGCSDENDFLMNRLEKIFKQVLFFRRQHVKILLRYDENFLSTPEVRDFVDILNCWLSFRIKEDYFGLHTLHKFCSSIEKMEYQTWAFKAITITIDQARNVFHYFYQHNYELLKMFYEWDLVHYEGGEFISDRAGN